VASGFEDLAALGDRECQIHAQSQSFDHRSEMPGVNDAAVDGRLPAHRVEPRTVEKGMPERVVHKSLVEARDGGGCVCDVGGECCR
jgi:hypothetical protein